MKAAHAAWVGLLLTGCVRFGYDALPRPEERPRDAGVPARPMGAGGAAPAGGGAGRGDAGAAGKASSAGTGGRVSAGARGRASAGAGGARAAAGGTAGAAGVAADPALGSSGLHLRDVLGYYSGDWGDMLLREQNGEVWGAYQYDGGTIVGKINAEGVFVGWWSQLPARSGFDAGEVEFRWSKRSSGVIALAGRWRYGNLGEWLENWDVDLVQDRTAPSALSARFDNPDDFVRHP